MSELNAPSTGERPLSTPQIAAPSLTRQATSGFKLMATQTIGIKIISAGAQFILAWLLVPKDFGLIGLAYTITSFTFIIQQAGLREILVQRHARFRRWSNPAFWMSLTLGFVACLLTLAAIPLGTWMYGNSSLKGLLILLGVSTPISSLTTVPTAKLQSDMRFSAIAKLGWIEGILTTVLTVMFAAMHFGAYSFALPRPIISTVLAIINWWIAPSPVRLNPQLRRWKFLIGDTMTLLLLTLAFTAISQGDYMMLGLFRGAADVGIYFFAFNLSTQTVQLLGLNLINVLFPALSKLQGDPGRQTRAYLQALGVLTSVGIPLCMLQAAAAKPFMHLMVASKWYPAIHVLEVLSVAMSLNLVVGTSYSLFKAQGRFAMLLIVNTIGAILFLTTVGIAANIGHALSVAFGVLLFNIVFFPVQIYVAIRHGGGKWSDLASALLPPALLGGIAATAGYLAGWLVPQMRLQSAIQIVVITMVFFGLYYALLRILAPQRLEQLFVAVRRR
jgi:O-antigen/teichoic acid export membrane protein